MLGWFRKPKAHAAPAGRQTSAPGAETDLDYLRKQADFDAEEMSSVHRLDTDGPRLGGSARALNSDSSTTTRLSPRSNESAHPAGQGAVVIAPQDRSTDAPGELVLSVQVGSICSVVSVREVVLIGRYDEEQDLTPEVDLSADDAVSRRHARIRRCGGQFCLQDLDSTNGTRLNGVWLTPETEFPLSAGDLIELGEASSLRVLDISFGTELTAEDEQLTDLLHEAMGVRVDREETSWPLIPSVRGGVDDGVDLLEVALSRGAEAGLLPSDESEYLPPAPAPQWRVRELGEIELPSFVEPYR